MRLYLIADLHLGPERPDHADRLGRLLDGLEADRDRLYILGDLFEVWLGDDAVPPAHEPVLDALAATTRRGVEVSIMHGNRDFLIGEAFCHRTGCRLIEDPFTLEIAGRPVLLCHGDTLCTDDVAYQAYRRQVRDPAVQQAFLSLPIEERERVAAEHRRQSRQENAGKQETIMDVNDTAVEALMREHRVRTLIHGHTHRPAHHRFMLDGLPAERIVLADWREHGHGLVIDEAAGGQTTIAID